MQTDRLTRTRINTVIVVIVTSNLRHAQSPGNVLLPAYFSGLPQDSVVNVTQVLTVDKSLLTEFVGDLPNSFMQQIEAGIKLVMGLL